MISTTSDYAINKADTEAIVYRDACGTVVRLTRKDFESEEEFLRWKEISDSSYHEIEKEEHLFQNYTLSLDGMAEGVLAVEPAETAMLDQITEAEREALRQLLVKGVNELLTEVQRTRFCLYYLENMPLREIGSIQGVDHKAVLRSIREAKIKILRFLKK